jgi:hypothetical protein
MGIAHVALGPSTSMGRSNSNAERSAASTELAASHKADLANRPTGASYGLRQGCEQRLRLGDRRHLRRRRKAFERGRKDSACFDETAGRLIKLGERKRREQPEGPRALLFCDGKGGFESFFGLRRVGWITLQQDIAAQSKQVGIVKPIPAFLTHRQSFVDQRQGSLIVLRSSFKPRKSAKKARNYDPIALIPIIR